MELTLKIRTCRFDDTPKHVLAVDGKDIYRIASLSECPEDAIIGRDLIDGNDLIEAIKMGYYAAKRGEVLAITVVDDED